MEKLSRYILIFVTVVSLSVMLPKLYWMAFEKPILKPFVLYSCVEQDFFIYRVTEGIWEDSKGTQYTREQYEQKLPIMFLRQLLSSGKMPSAINGVDLDMKAITKSKSFFRLKSSDIDRPVSALYPLFESQSGRVVFEWPEDFFRITWRIEFIVAATNKVNEEKSQMFSAALYHNGFQFPAKKIVGISSLRKSCDEGYLIVDSKEQLFHLKMIKGKPYVRKVNVPEGLKFRQISCVDFKNKAFYAYLFSDKNEIYILTQSDYDLIKWPVTGFDLSKDDLKIYGDLFNFTVVIEGDDHVKAVALSPDYKLIDTYEESWQTKEKRSEGKIFASVFPVQLSLTNENSRFVRFYFSPSVGYYWLIVNFLLVIWEAGLIVMRRRNLKDHLYDLGIVAVCGIYGFIAVHIFQDKLRRPISPE